MKKHFSTVFLLILFFVGFSVMLYPSVSDWWNSWHQSRAIISYNEQIEKLPEEKYDDILNKAYEYNRMLSSVSAPFSNPDAVSNYQEILDISGTGIIGYISIPVINVELPIYHGTSDEILNVAAGHLQGSSLPVGGESTHAVISGHRGLPSAKLFTDLDKMVVGDTFTINVLNEVLTYEVEEILIIKPDQVEKLAIVPGKDYVTLMTCTPYGINTHRLLIRSHRIDTVYEKKVVRVSADAMQVDSMTVAPIAAVPILIFVLIFWNISGKRKQRRLKIIKKYRNY